MDADRFDRLARAVWSATHTRRAGLGALSAAVLGRLGLAQAAAQPGCKDAGAICGAGAECCSKLCSGGRCVCRRVGQRCAVGVNCCGRICIDGFCRCDPDEGSRCPRNRLCCDDGFCEECCDNGDCPPDASCCRDPELPNFCKANSECGQDRDCGVGNRCKDCEVCVCDAAKCRRDLDGCCPPDDPIGFCQPGFGPKYCGKAGETCKICNLAKGQKCHPDQRRCVCDAAKCKQRNGCCHPTSKTCEEGTARTACGKGGKTCQDCSKKGTGWICRDQRCCVDEGGACPAGCDADGACAQCCGGRCKGGKCAAACGVECPPPRECCGSRNQTCCAEGRVCCDNFCAFVFPGNCGGCGKPCPDGADRCVNGTCKCGSEAPCDCTKGAMCYMGRCVCKASPGYQICRPVESGDPCSQNEVPDGFPCPTTDPPLCRCTTADYEGRCLMPT